MFCLESKCEVAVVGREVFPKCVDESIDGWRILFQLEGHTE